MNKIKGTISTIEKDEGISFVSIEAAGSSFSAILIEATSSKLPLETGMDIFLTFKETSMSLAKNLSGDLSIRNHFDCTVTKLEKSKILTKVKLDFHGIRFVSIITTASAERLNLTAGDQVTGLVKTPDITLMKNKEPWLSSFSRFG
jgi:molybdate transport system regulatory protein